LSAGITFTSADNGETVSYYPPDGYNSAVFDRGITAMTTFAENWAFLINGASYFSINGLMVQNFGAWGIGVHGGPADSIGGGSYFTAVGTCVNVSITNNIVQNGYTDNNTTNANSGWSGGGIYGSGSTLNLQILNNVVLNQYGSGIRFTPSDSSGNTNPSGNQNGLTIKNNVCLLTNQATGDNGAIYLQDINFNSTGITVSNNFIRDYQSSLTLRNGTSPTRDVAIYLDEGACNVSILGNVIGNTSNPISSPSGSNASTMPFYSSSGHDNIWKGNIVDLGTTADLMNLDYELDASADPPATIGNVVQNNLFIGNWSGAQQGYGSGGGPYAYGGGSTSGNPAIANNLYYNYGSGSLSTTGSAGTDSNPTSGINPLISGATYSLASNSPAYSLVGGFTAIIGNWGPPGYAIPPSGTAPCYG
jgi:hypothetical protein